VFAEDIEVTVISPML